MQRKTKQREHIREALTALGRPLSPTEIFNQAKKRCPSLSLATVYRGINNLLEEGKIVRVSLPGEPDRYETDECAAHHHHHFHCDECRKVFDVAGCAEKLHPHLPEGFSVIRHEIVYYGNCKDCQKSELTRLAR